MLDHRRHFRTLAAIQRWDPLAFILLSHGVAMALAGETQAPLAVSLLSGVLAVARLGLGGLGRQDITRIQFARSLVSVVVSYAVVVVDGGVESPFFFWVLLILGWQVLDLPQRQFRILGYAALFGYLAVLVITGELTTPTLFRAALLAAFVFVLSLGRWMLDLREAEVARLDEVVKGIMNDAPLAVAVFDHDRETLLYANAAAHAMGIASLDTMAHLLLEEENRSGPVTTLADLVMGAGFRRSSVRSYRHLREGSTYRIGFHPRMVDGAPPIVVVYGLLDGEQGTMSWADQ
ncbi:MAG TPA: hypothetical protein VF377_03690 [Acidimicrobiia bacterium]|jgi:hypothetical protein